MKARDLTPACIGRIVRIERVRPVEGKLTTISAMRDGHGYLRLVLSLGGRTVALRGDEPVSITG